MALLYSIGHSNRPTRQLLTILSEAGVRRLVDVRRFPRSKRHPHYSGASLGLLLGEAGIEYRHEEELGGYRKARPDTVHTALAEGFRGYADHMESAAYGEALARLAAWGEEIPTAFLCAEADPEYCHRNLLSDALVLRGHRVMHLVDEGETREHEPHRAAVLEDDRVTYRETPPAQMGLFR